ncbi:carbohydrate ABC transporter permease [Paenibacillus dendrobii]|nr:carbohydrate ABC transporter permease [Paenibacillus dendrobii]
MRRSFSYRVFSVANHLFLVLISLLCILPLLHILAVSLSSKAAATANIVKFWPVELTFDAYRLTIENSFFIGSLWNSIERTVLGTLISMVLCITAAYALSKENRVFPGRTFYSWFFIFTMLFSAGLIPSYLVVTNLGIKNTIWALVLPGAVSVYNMVLMLNFFRGIPKDLEEAAFMDGAGHFVTLWKVYLPLSMPSVATLSLFSMVGNWNAWFDGLIYLNNAQDYPLATLLQQLTAGIDMSTSSAVNADALKNIAQRTVKAAQIFLSMIPILIVYPFLQRYFVQGMTLGSVKE